MNKRANWASPPGHGPGQVIRSAMHVSGSMVTPFGFRALVAQSRSSPLGSASELSGCPASSEFWGRRPRR